MESILFQLQKHKFLMFLCVQVCVVFLLFFLTWTGCNFLATLPIPSTVVTATRCREQRGARQALMA